MQDQSINLFETPNVVHYDVKSRYPKQNWETWKKDFDEFLRSRRNE